MFQATLNGNLKPIPNCHVIIPGGNPSVIQLDNLPTLSDSKSAVYNDENIIGRSNPLHTYSHSANRNINLTFHFLVVKPGDAKLNINKLRTLQSACYPREGQGGAPFQPPPVCKIRCGDLLASQDLCVVMQSYTVQFPDDVPWYVGEDGGTYCPYKFEVQTSWLVVYTSSDLPFQSRIVQSGR